MLEVQTTNPEDDLLKFPAKQRHREVNPINSNRSLFYFLILSCLIHIGGALSFQYFPSVERSFESILRPKSQKKQQHIQLLQKSLAEKTTIPLSDLIFNSEFIELQEQLPIEKAIEIYELAKKRYDNLIAKLRYLNANNKPDQDIINELIKYSGEYSLEADEFVTKLLFYGEGDCLSRMKLMLMPIQDIFGDKYETFIALVNEKEEGETKYTKHTFAVIRNSETGKHYRLELPKMREMSQEEMNEVDIYPASELLTVGYLVSQKVLTVYNGPRKSDSGIR